MMTDHLSFSVNDAIDKYLTASGYTFNRYTNGFSVNFRHKVGVEEFFYSVVIAGGKGLVQVFAWLGLTPEELPEGLPTLANKLRTENHFYGALGETENAGKVEVAYWLYQLIPQTTGFEADYNFVVRTFDAVNRDIQRFYGAVYELRLRYELSPMVTSTPTLVWSDGRHLTAPGQSRQ